MLSYLFKFDFEKGCMNDYIREFLKGTNTDYFYNHCEIYADLFGTDNYYHIEIIDLPGKRKEVYFDTDKVISGNGSEGKTEKAIKTNDYESTYFVRLTFEDGDTCDTRINGCHESILNYYLNNMFTLHGNYLKCIGVDFLETVR